MRRRVWPPAVIAGGLGAAGTMPESAVRELTAAAAAEAGLKLPPEAAGAVVYAYTDVAGDVGGVQVEAVSAEAEALTAWQGPTRHPSSAVAGPPAGPVPAAARPAGAASRGRPGGGDVGSLTEPRWRSPTVDVRVEGAPPVELRELIGDPVQLYAPAPTPPCRKFDLLLHRRSAEGLSSDGRYWYFRAAPAVPTASLNWPPPAPGVLSTLPAGR